MSHLQSKFIRCKELKLFATCCLALLLTACSSTPAQVVNVPVNSYVAAPEVIDMQCVAQGTNIAQAAATSGSSAQYVSSARYLQACLHQPLPELDKSEGRAVMQVMANITLNFIQGGDIGAAKLQILKFDQAFPHQDLLLPDFTSFRDTATALLHSASMNTAQLANLNISRELRAELERQQYWLSH